MSSPPFVFKVAGVREYLVFFVTDPVDDALAEHVQARVQMLAASRAWRDQPPGYFDEPEPAPDSPRTTGGFLRVEDGPADGDDVRAFCAAIQAFSAEFGVDVELQWREAVLGRVRGGVPDDRLEEQLAVVTGEN
jgi:hypothetical protein